MFLRFWDKVYVSSLRAKQANKCVCSDGLAGNVMGTNQVAGGKVGCGQVMDIVTSQLGLGKEDWKKEA